MITTEPMDGENPSDNLICPRCGSTLPNYTKFCSVCGRRIKEEKEQGDTEAKNSDGPLQGQEADDTVRVSSPSYAQWKGLQTDPLLTNNGITGQTHKGSSLPLDVETPIAEKLTEPSLLIPEIETKKHSALPLSQLVEQQITKPYASTASLSTAWGWFPALSLISATGVFLVALAYEGGRVAAAYWPQPLFWLGLLIIFLPIALRLLSSKPTRRERIALIIVLAICLYLVAYLQYPLYFTGYDEFLHWRTALDIITSGHLFQSNPLLPISSYYPGLEIITTALSNLTGLSLFATGTMLIGLVQLVFVLSLYLFYERCTESAHLAGIATVVYMANPNFLFFDMSFAYESLALPLSVFVLFAIALRGSTRAGHRRGLSLAIWFSLGAVVITHHLTSYALVAFLLFWTAMFLLLRKVTSFHQNSAQKAPVGPSPGAIALLGLVLTLAWLTYTGDLAVGYLGPHVVNAIQQITQILAGESAPRQLFHNPAGFVVPLWERMFSYASIALIVLGLCFGFFQIWRHHRTNAIALALAGAALAYPASQALRLTPAGGEAGDRATEFVFVGIAFVLVIGARKFWFSRTPNWRQSAVLVGMVSLICFGQLILGSGQPWTLLPGPYLVSADDRSIEPEGITAAQWANSYLGPGQRIASDRINTLLMGTYGDEQVVTGGNGDIPVSQVFTSLQLGVGVEAILQQDKIQYLVVDRRLSTSLPRVGTYFNEPGSGGQPITKPIDPTALAKFDGVQNVSRIFDSGDIIIYDVEAISNGSSTSSTQQSLCTPPPSIAGSSSYPMVAQNYTGTMLDIPSGLTIKISLTGIQQQKNSMCGSFGGVPTNGPFKGTITTAGQTQFIVTNNTGQATFSFDGLLLPDGTLAGSYCSPAGGTGSCSDYGLWSLSPAP